MSPHQKRIMENNAIFEEVRLLLREDDPAGALHLLIEKLKDNDAFDEVVRTLRVIETEVHSAKQNERKGILTYHDARQIFSKAIDSIHCIIDDLERGRAPQTGHLADTAPAPTTSSSSRKALVAIFSLLVMVVAGWVWFKKSDQPPITKTSPDRGKTDVCPAYTREGVRVLILPFQSFGSETDKPELAFQTQIRDLTGRNNLPSMVEVYRGTLQANSTPDIEKAAQIGRNCGADLVIWGQYDRSRDALKIDTRYVFTQTSRSGKTSFQSVPDLPALTQGKMYRSLEDAVFSICTIMAIRERNETLASKWLDRIKTPTPDDIKMRELLVSDANPENPAKSNLRRKTMPQVKKNTE